MKLNDYLSCIHEEDKNDDVKIHPKLKTASSVAVMANPLDDILLGSGGAALASKMGFKKKATEVGKELITGDALKKAKRISNLKKLGKAGIGLGVGIASGAAMIAGYRAIRSLFDDCVKKCGTMSVNTPKRQLCLLTCHRNTLIKKISFMKQHKEDKEKINKEENKLKILDKKIILYRKYLFKHNKENKYENK